MKIQRAFFALTVVNLGLLVFLLAQMQPVEARGEAPVLRGRALEIVDDQGRVRANALSGEVPGSRLASTAASGGAGTPLSPNRAATAASWSRWMRLDG